MRFLYICGPMKAKTGWEREKNIRRAEGVALELLKAGAAVFCPHSMCRNFDAELSLDEWLERDFAVLNRCDGLVLVHPSWMTSAGARAEEQQARNRGIRTFQMYDADDHAQLIEFLKDTIYRCGYCRQPVPEFEVTTKSPFLLGHRNGMCGPVLIEGNPNELVPS